MKKITQKQILENIRVAIRLAISLLKEEWEYCLTDDATLSKDIKDVADFRVNLLQYFENHGSDEYFENMGYLIRLLRVFGIPNGDIYKVVEILQLLVLIDVLPNIDSGFELSKEQNKLVKQFNKITGVVLT